MKKETKRKIGCCLAPFVAFFLFLVFGVAWGVYVQYKKEHRINEPEITREFEYYDIYGTTGPELAAQIDLIGPKDDNAIPPLGRDKSARTTSDITWDPAYKKLNDGGCMLQGVVMPVKMTILYPRWANEAEGTPELQAKWEKYVAWVEEHEEHHVTDELTKVDEIYNMLMNLPTNLPCDELDTLAKSNSDDIQARYVDVAREFDLSEHYAAQQGLNAAGILRQ